MIDERQFIQNQYMKIHSLDVEKNPINYFFYSNGIHVLFIKKGKTKYLLCGLNTPYHVLYRQSSVDVLAEHTELQACVKDFERFINLLLLPRKFEVNVSVPYERDLF